MIRLEKEDENISSLNFSYFFTILKNQQARMLYSMGFLRKVVFLSLKIILCLQVPNGPFFGIIFYNENDW